MSCPLLPKDFAMKLCNTTSLPSLLLSNEDVGLHGNMLSQLLPVFWSSWCPDRLSAPTYCALLPFSAIQPPQIFLMSCPPASPLPWWMGMSISCFTHEQCSLDYLLFYKYALTWSTHAWSRCPHLLQKFVDQSSFLMILFFSTEDVVGHRQLGEKLLTSQPVLWIPILWFWNKSHNKGIKTKQIWCTNNIMKKQGMHDMSQGCSQGYNPKTGPKTDPN